LKTVVHCHGAEWFARGDRRPVKARVIEQTPKRHARHSGRGLNTICLFAVFIVSDFFAAGDYFMSFEMRRPWLRVLAQVERVSFLKGSEPEQLCHTLKSLSMQACLDQPRGLLRIASTAIVCCVGEDCSLVNCTELLWRLVCIHPALNILEGLYTLLSFLWLDRGRLLGLICN